MAHDQTLSDVVAVDAWGQLEQIRAVHDRALGGLPFVVDSAGGVKDDDLVFGIEGEDGLLIGYVYASVQPPQRVHVWEVAVDPTVQRRGLGRALLRRLAEFCDARGFELITVTPFAAPAEVARAFFGACGFHGTDPEQAVQATPGEVLSATRAEPADPAVLTDGDRPPVGERSEPRLPGMGSVQLTAPGVASGGDDRRARETRHPVGVSTWAGVGRWSWYTMPRLPRSKRGGRPEDHAETSLTSVPRNQRVVTRPSAPDGNTI